MKVEMKAKLLQYFLNRNDTGGFSMTGLLVRIFLYSCVAGAVLLPSYIRPCGGWSCHILLSSFNHNIYVKAQTYIGALNRAQQACNLEVGGFATIDKLGVVIKPESTDYSYHILPNGPVQTSNDPKELAPSFKAAINIAQPKKPNLKGYIGVVYTIQDKKLTKSTARSILCQEVQPSTFVSPRLAPFRLPLSNGEDKCPEGWEMSGR